MIFFYTYMCIIEPFCIVKISLKLILQLIKKTVKVMCVRTLSLP